MLFYLFSPHILCVIPLPVSNNWYQSKIGSPQKTTWSFLYSIHFFTYHILLFYFFTCYILWKQHPCKLEWSMLKTMELLSMHLERKRQNVNENTQLASASIWIFVITIYWINTSFLFREKKILFLVQRTW